MDPIKGVETDEDILNFVQNLRKADIVNDVLAVPGGVYLGGQKKLNFLRGKFLVRQCYIELKNQIMKISEAQLRDAGCSTNFIILGNPGIGKSLFVYYMLYVLMYLKKTIVWQYSTEADGREAVRITQTSISFADNLRPFKRDLAKPTTWYIVDARPPKHVTAITLLVTSPDRSRWREFAKEGTLKRYMPIWSDAEIKMVKPRGMAFAQGELGVKELDDNVIKEQYRIWGGVPRFVFHQALEVDVNELMQQAVNDMDVANLHKYIGVSDGRDARHQVTHMIVTIDCAEDDRYRKYVMDFASDYARKLVLKRTLELNHERVKEFITAASGEAKAAVFRGILFEAYAHQMMCSGREFVVRKLDETAPNEQKPFPVKFGNSKLTLKEFKRVSDIKEPENWKDYFVSTSTNYPSIDSLLYPNCLFQMTVGSDHTINVDGLKEAVDDMLARRMRASREEKNIRFYFVVPKDNFDFFKRQKYTDDEPTFPDDVRVDQYVLQADLQLSYFGNSEVATTPVNSDAVVEALDTTKSESKG